MRKVFIACLFLLGLGWALFNFKGLATQGKFDSIVLDFRDDVPAAVLDEKIAAIARQYNVEPIFNSEFSAKDHVYIVEGDRKLLNALKKSDIAKQTEFIEPNYIYNAYGVPNDPDYSKQWNLRSINVESAWDETKGAGVTVAVIDTGVSVVPDLKDTKFVPGYDFVNNKENADDDNGHGTHVAGTVAQATNNGYGVAGVAYEASIMPLKVLSGSGGGTVSDIAEAIKFAADNGAGVINMSLGGGGESQLMQEAIEYAHSKGVVIVAAAGNSDENEASYPARYPRVIGVSALNSAGEKAFYSSYGAGVDISAPGGDTSKNQLGGILQETIGYDDEGNIITNFAAYQGTSMAAPHVAGVAALVKASGITEPDEVLSVLKQSARAVAEDPLNHFGSGHLDAGAAVKLALRGQITFKDFFRWLRDNGYLSPRFWLDGGAVALLPKIAMVLGSYMLAWFLRNYFPWAGMGVIQLHTGLIAGSSGLFFLRGFYIFDLPQWPFRVMGSSIPELGGAVQGSTLLNPILASVLVPLILVVLLLGHQSWKWLAIGSAVGVASCLAVSAVVDPAMLWLGDGAIARTFLIVNALLCVGIAYLASKGEHQTA
ncbi:peptidase S8 [Microcoleus sp. FACHB-831]|uniref:S8 family peptidase n=1 Tax=Microcoleus sp. FACHB-831 TaxID=2692827 RepID=UPI00168351D6|nr:S8 family peptidase [Microcoleus sp. FACHB-831]MBD1921100.1 peptidase S8 [Microcoleus sp. FACHB-831]